MSEFRGPRCVSNRLFWDLSHETAFPHDLFKKGVSDQDLAFTVWAVESVSCGRFPSKVDEYDIYFLLDWALEYVHGSAIEGILKLCQESQVIKVYRMKILAKALRGHPDVDAAMISQYICDPAVDFPLSDSLSVEAMSRRDHGVLKLIACGALNPNARDSKGRSLLMCYVSKCSDIAISLIKHGARVDLVDNDSKTALDHLILSGGIARSVQVAKLLVAGGSVTSLSPDALHKWDGTPLIRFLKLLM
jgi:hypothetical protein